MIFKEHQSTENKFFTFPNMLSLALVGGCLFLSIVSDGDQLKLALIGAATSVLVLANYFSIIRIKDEEIRALHLEAKRLAIRTSNVTVENALKDTTTVEVINTENISGNITADKLVTTA